MKIAIDETGDFSPKSNFYHFLSAVHLQSRDNNSELIYDRFDRWEKNLPRSLKNHKGEIKSTRLTIDQLDAFIEQVIFPNLELQFQLLDSTRERILLKLLTSINKFNNLE